jgi:phage-related protein
MQPDVNVAPLFATLEANQVDGIATKFIKLMTVFASLPSKIVQQIQEAVEFGEQLKNAFKKLITNVAEGVQELLDVLLGLVWSIITSAINVTSAIVLEAASVYQLVVFFVKYFIVSMISFLLGSGLIALSAASILGIA